MTDKSLRRLVAVLEYPDFVEAHIQLIDALRDYIHAHDELGMEFLRDGEITREQYRKWQAGDRQTMRLLLAKLEAEEVDDGTVWELMQRVLKVRS
jgi:hypothetical protein